MAAIQRLPTPRKRRGNKPPRSRSLAPDPGLSDTALERAEEYRASRDYPKANVLDKMIRENPDDVLQPLIATGEVLPSATFYLTNASIYEGSPILNVFVRFHGIPVLEVDMFRLRHAQTGGIYGGDGALYGVDALWIAPREKAGKAVLRRLV